MNMSNAKITLRILALLSILFSEPIKAQTDSVFISLDDFVGYLRAHHPLVKKYKLISASAKQELLATKGQLDPTISSQLNEKSFDGNTYYSIWENQLKIPTWFGPDVKLSYDANSGKYLNSSDLLPSSGLVGLGVSVPIGNGIVIDSRRNAIKQAKLFTKMAEAEQNKVMNKFLLGAIKDYWEWHFAFSELLQFNNAYKLVKERYLFTIERVKQGDAAPIDTVEISIQMQNILVNLNNAGIDYYNTGMILNTYLWKDETTPVELSSNMFPKRIEPLEFRLLNDSIQKAIDWAQNNNPEIRKQQLKIDQIKVEQLFAKNNLLPKLNADLSMISSGSDFESGRFFTPTNYKLGGNLYVPIFLRKERGKLGSTKIKLLDASYELQQINRELQNTIKANLNECLVLWNQINVQKQIVNNSTKLRNAEKLNFDNGESSVFLINSREMSLLSNQIKYLEMVMKYQKAQAALYNTIGNLSARYGLN